MLKRCLYLGAALLLAGCTAANTVRLGGRIGDRNDIVITTGGLDRPCRSIGMVQVTATGLWFLGFIEVMPADVEFTLRQELAAEAARYGADAVINVHFYELQYPLILRLLSVVTLISPQYCVVTGELVEFSS